MTTTTPSAPIQKPSPRTGSPRTAWLIAAAVVGISLSLVAGIVIGRLTVTPPVTPGLAGPTITAMLADRVAAVNSGPSDVIATFYSDDAVLEEHDQQPPVITAGAEAIGDHLGSYQQMGLRLRQTGTATQLGPFVAEPLLWSGGDGGLVVYLLDEDGRIAHQWVTGGSIPGVPGP